MASSNPYAPPVHDDFGAAPLGSNGGFSLLGDTLTCEKGASLPNICLFSGEVGNERVSRMLSWAPQWFIFVAVMSPLLGAILYYVVRKSGKLDYSLSTAAKKRARGGAWLAFGGVIGGIALLMIGGAADLPVLALLAIVGALIAIVVGSVRSRVFTVARIDKQQIQLKLQPNAARAFERHLAGQPVAY